MKKQLKWLLVGSLMCLGLGSVFQASFGVDSPEVKYLKQQAAQGSVRVIGDLLDAYRHGWYGLKPNDPEGLVFAKEYANKGSQVAIKILLDAYRHGWYGLKPNDPQGLVLAQKYVNQGSQVAKDFLKYNAINK